MIVILIFVVTKKENTSAREWSMRRTSDRTLSLTSWKAPWCHWGWPGSLLKAWGADSDWVKRRLSRASRNERGAITSLWLIDLVQECREWLECEHVWSSLAQRYSLCLPSPPAGTRWLWMSTTIFPFFYIYKFKIQIIGLNKNLYI